MTQRRGLVRVNVFFIFNFNEYENGSLILVVYFQNRNDGFDMVLSKTFNVKHKKKT
jgi:hypothetical protein